MTELMLLAARLREAVPTVESLELAQLLAEAGEVLNKLAIASETLPPEGAGEQACRHAAQALVADRDAEMIRIKRGASGENSRLVRQIFSLWDALEPLAGWVAQGHSNTDELRQLAQQASDALVRSKAELIPSAEPALLPALAPIKPVIWLELDPSAALLARPPERWHQLCSHNLHFSDPGNCAANAVFPLYAESPAEMHALAMQYRQVAQVTAARNAELAAQLCAATA